MGIDVNCVEPFENDANLKLINLMFENLYREKKREKEGKREKKRERKKKNEQQP